MKKEDNINVPRWFLEEVENTLRIQHNINEPDKKKTGESCQDRNIKESLNGLRKLLKGIQDGMLEMRLRSNVHI